MPCPRATRGPHKRRINFLLARPSWQQARVSKVLRQHLNKHGYLTPNFSADEMADTQTHYLPRNLRHAAIRHCWNLERFSRDLAFRSRRYKAKRINITINGPTRTHKHNAEVHGATDSQHLHGDASDHYAVQVAAWQLATGFSRDTIIHIASRYFTAVGNETSDTLHLDSRPGKPGTVYFVHWAGEQR